MRRPSTPPPPSSPWRATPAEHLGAAVAGFAEATFFVLVPDVWTSRVALHGGTRRGLATTPSALAGALVGGACTHTLSRRLPSATTHRLLTALPGISDGTVRTVEAQVARPGHLALLTGPARGIPYKVFARGYGRLAAGTDDGGRGDGRRSDGGRGDRGLLPFLAASVPARLPRFVAVTAGIGALAGLVRGRPWATPARAEAIFWAGWTAFYAWYFPAVRRAHRAPDPHAARLPTRPPA